MFSLVGAGASLAARRPPPPPSGGAVPGGASCSSQAAAARPALASAAWRLVKAEGSRAFLAYSRALKSHPYRTKSATSFVIMTLADYCCQVSLSGSIRACHRLLLRRQRKTNGSLTKIIMIIVRAADSTWKATKKFRTGGATPMGSVVFVCGWLRSSTSFST
jgi:hypothetical protein